MRLYRELHPAVAAGGSAQADRTASPMAGITGRAQRHAGDSAITLATGLGHEMMIITQQAPAASMLAGIVPVTPHATERA